MRLKQFWGNVSIWWPVAFVLFAAVLVIIFGIWGGGFVAGNTDAFSNAIRSLQWETMTAGLFGLAGGCLVLVATRQQIEHVKRHAIEQVVDQELSPYFQLEADIRYLVQDAEILREASSSWRVINNTRNYYDPETTSLLLILNSRMNDLISGGTSPVVVSKVLRLIRAHIIQYYRWADNDQPNAESETIALLCPAIVELHEAILTHREQLIRARSNEFDFNVTDSSAAGLDRNS
ncbi:hypothetical protein COO20_06705 [Thalassospira marina]|uniref:DUF4760 domain-containing protein n=2 Tax=Thalassospira marina TaxID=2048283 RepID=A0A2N3KWX3_9PROT|nr:hypothetical protein COO20_06705 [Thalassospira marina]